MMHFEGENRIYIGGQATLLDDIGSKEVASEWAAKHIIPNPANAWVLGNFVEADRPNNNKQMFALGDLQMYQPTISYAPMNINHSPRHVVGTFVASEMLHPQGEGEHAIVEALSAFWKYYFPDEYGMVAKAHQDGGVFFSMEAVPREISSVGGSDDSKRYPYEGRVSPNYPKDINERAVDGILLHNPHFVGGALVIPPARPGWSRADIKQISKFMHEEWMKAEAIYEGVKNDMPHLDATAWETLMGELILLEKARDFNAGERKKAAGKGQALKDGSFPIKTEADLKNAIRLAGKAKDPAAARAHIKKRASALGLSKLIPDSWK